MVLLLVGVISKFANHTMRKSLWWAPGTLSNCESEVTVQREGLKKQFFFFHSEKAVQSERKLVQGEDRDTNLAKEKK